MDIGGQWATLVSIIIGLGIADLLVNLHRLIHARKEVKWDPLPLGWAAIALVAGPARADENRHRRQHEDAPVGREIAEAW